MIDKVAIEASAKRIIDLANQLPEKRRIDFIAEAAAILKLMEAVK